MTFVLASISDSLPGGSVFIENRLGELRTYYEIMESIKKKYKLSDTIKLGEVKVMARKPEDPQTVKVRNSRQMYGKPEGEVIITPQMQGYDNPVEILRGHMAGVAVTGSYPDYRIYIRGIGSINAQRPPLVLIDGIDATFGDLISMPISFIDRIDVLKSIAAITIFGMKAENGVINLITRAGGPAYVSPEYSQNLKLSGFYASRVFYSPQHLNDSASAYQPDLRTTLFWKPDINLKGNKEALLNYYNGDNHSIFTIIVEGITSSGTPLVGKSEYEVR